MKQKSISIEQAILDRYPEVAIGYMVVDDLHHVSSKDITEEVKSIAFRGIKKQKLTPQSLIELKTINQWRSIYQDCGVKPKTYKSSVESIVRRFLALDYRKIIPVVDLYNYISAGYVLSVGGYNYDKIIGYLSLRYARINDQFVPLSGKQDIALAEEQIVYADEDRLDNVICWMWNHKDSKRTMLTEEVKTGLFILDCPNKEDRPILEQGQSKMAEILIQCGSSIRIQGILDVKNPSVAL